MRKPTIYDIKYDVTNTDCNNHYFFSRKSMRFFGQTLKDFSVRKSPMGRIFILAPSYFDGRIAGYTFKEYCNHTLINPKYDNGLVIPNAYNDLQAILDFIQSH